jgi:hypothetical protein
MGSFPEPGYARRYRTVVKAIEEIVASRYAACGGYCGSDGRGLFPRAFSLRGGIEHKLKDRWIGQWCYDRNSSCSLHIQTICSPILPSLLSTLLRRHFQMRDPILCLNMYTASSCEWHDARNP